MKKVITIVVMVPTLCLIAAGAFFVFVTLPRIDEVDALKERITAAANAARDRQDTWHDVESFITYDAKAVAGAARILDSAVGLERRLPEFFPLLAALAADAGVELTSCTLGTGNGSGTVAVSAIEATADAVVSDYKTLQVGIEALGPPERILQFIDLIESARQPISVAEAEIRRDERKLLQTRVRILANIVIRV